MHKSLNRRPAKASGGIRLPAPNHSITRLTVLVSILIGLAPLRLPAQTNAASESRYLLIFDTSAAMKRRVENVQRVAGDLIHSGMHGQMRPGDTIGVWTFNETLYAGKLPLLRWSPERRVALASRVTEFVRTQKFERVSSFLPVMPVLQRVVTNSSKLTVLIFSDGMNPLTGTPYDAQINAAYEPFRDTQRQERMPFVTVLRAKNQEYLGYAVTPSPWAVEFPKFPPEPVVVAPNVEPKPQPPKPAVPPLIVIGKKDTNTTPAVELPQPGSEPKPEPKPGMTEAEKRFVKLAAEQGVELPANYGSNVGASVTTPAATQRTNASVEQSKPIPAASEPPKPAPPSAGTTSTAQKNPEPKPAPVASNEPMETSKSEPEIQAVVSPAAKNSGRLLLIAAVASILVVALAMVYALLRRRHRAHVSLITSSMDRGRK